MEDRSIDISTEIILEKGKSNGLDWFVKGENEDYIAPEVFLISRSEAQQLQEDGQQCYDLFKRATQKIIEHRLYEQLGIPESAVPLIEYSWNNQHPHILGRFDFAGGIDQIPTKLIEFNADTCTQLPEVAYLQDWLAEPIRQEFKGQFNYLVSDLEKSFSRIKAQFPDKAPTLLLTSLGYIEDQLNLEVLKEAGQLAGFHVQYADLEAVIFDEDAVLLPVEDGYLQFNFVFKLIPWEFIVFEEPELLKDLTRLVVQHQLIILNPAYSLIMQAKRLMSILWDYFPGESLLLPTYNNQESLDGKAQVEKVNFGRMGENIQILDIHGAVVEKSDGDFDQPKKIYQQLARMYRDEENDIYQIGIYVVDGKASGLSVRRRDGLIIDDDAEFIAHVLF